MNLTIRQNVSNSALSQYTDFFFGGGVVSLGGKVLALGCDSLCELTGDTDKGAKINARFRTGSVAHGNGEKRVRAIHLKGKFDTPSAVAVDYSCGSDDVTASGVRATPSRLGRNGSGNLRFMGQRTEFGEHLSVEVSNVNGADFVVSRIEAVLVVGRRR